MRKQFFQVIDSVITYQIKTVYFFERITKPHFATGTWVATSRPASTAVAGPNRFHKLNSSHNFAKLVLRRVSSVSLRSRSTAFKLLHRYSHESEMGRKHSIRKHCHDKMHWHSHSSVTHSPGPPFQDNSVKFPSLVANFSQSTPILCAKSTNKLHSGISFSRRST